jgi:DNA-binding MarR family transcriptional regulator
MHLEESVLRVQTAYPRIYLACHSRHQNARSTADRLSQRDASLLAHLEEETAISHADLARHMSVAKSTLSEALTNLEEQGFVVRQAGEQDGRGSFIRRTRKGSVAMSNGSVLEPERLRRLLQTLTPEERQRAIEGLELIAQAAEKQADQQQKERNDECQ